MKDEKTIDTIKKYFSDRKYVLLLLLWVVHIVWYFLVNTYRTNCHLIHIPLDDKIPYIRFFVIPYVMWYGYIAFAHIWTFFHSKRDFLTMCSLIFLSVFISVTVYTIYPSMHDMRPADEALGSDLFGNIVRWLYSTENPNCILPSEHCLLAIVITVGLIFSDGFKGNLAVKILCPIYTLLVMLATVFIKQHSIVDVFASTALSVPICLLTYFVICPKKRFAPKAAQSLPAPEPVVMLLAEEKKEEGLPVEKDSESR